MNVILNPRAFDEESHYNAQQIKILKPFINLVMERLMIQVSQQSIMLCVAVLQFPERIFHAPSGITSLSFSKKNPNLLAVSI